LAVVGVAAPVGAAHAQPFTINGSGATLQQSFFQAPASTNDFIDVNGDGISTPSFGAQLAPFDVFPPFDPNMHWQMTYRVVGSGNGFNQLIAWGATFATLPDGDPTNLTLQTVFSDESLVNRTPYVSAGVPQSISNLANPDGIPFTSVMDGSYMINTAPGAGGMQIDFAALDVPVAWFVRQGLGEPAEAAAVANALPRSFGYGQNPRISQNKDGSVALDILGNPQSNKLSSLLSQPLSAAAGMNVFMNTNTSAPDSLTIFDTSISITPVAAMVNYGVGMQQITMSDLRHLSATGRRMNGENLMYVNRDVGSGTRNAFMNGVELDPSWGAGENIGPRTVSSVNDLVGPNFQPSNKGGSSRLEATVINERLAVGHTGAERGVSRGWLTQGRAELLAVQNDLKGGTAFVRPTAANVLNNDANGYTINGPATIATIGDPMSAPATLGGWGFAASETGPNPNPVQAMRNPQAAAYLNNITRSISAVTTAPGSNPTIFSPGEFLATNFVLVAAASFTPDPPGSITPNPNLNTFLQNFSLNDPTNIFNDPAFVTFNTASAGLVPVRTAGPTYSDGVVGGGHFTTQAHVAVPYGSILTMRNKIAGDFNNDGVRNTSDVNAMLQAWDDRHGSATPFQAGTDAIIEVLGDFDGDGSFTTDDVRYWADGLAINPSGNADRQLGFTLVDQASAGLPNQITNFFGTTLATGAVYNAGDARGDVTNSTLNNLPNFVPSNSAGVGADGVIDCSDITYVYNNFGNFANTFEAVSVVQVPDPLNPGQMLTEPRVIDLSADMNGDLVVNLADIRVLVEGILKTTLGDVNLDGVRDVADAAIAQANLGQAGTYCTGDVNGDGVVNNSDLAIINGAFNPFCTSDLNGDGTVNGADIAFVLNSFGSTGAGIPADLNGDGTVNGADIAFVLNSFGPCP